MEVGGWGGGGVWCSWWRVGGGEVEGYGDSQSTSSSGITGVGGGDGPDEKEQDMKRGIEAEKRKSVLHC